LPPPPFIRHPFSNLSFLPREYVSLCYLARRFFYGQGHRVCTNPHPRSHYFSPPHFLRLFFPCTLQSRSKSRIRRHRRPPNNGSGFTDQVVGYLFFFWDPPPNLRCCCLRSPQEPTRTPPRNKMRSLATTRSFFPASLLFRCGFFFRIQNLFFPRISSLLRVQQSL